MTDSVEETKEANKEEVNTKPDLNQKEAINKMDLIASIR